MPVLGTSTSASFWKPEGPSVFFIQLMILSQRMDQMGELSYTEVSSQKGGNQASARSTGGAASLLFASVMLGIMQRSPFQLAAACVLEGL